MDAFAIEFNRFSRANLQKFFLENSATNAFKNKIMIYYLVSLRYDY